MCVGCFHVCNLCLVCLEAFCLPEWQAACVLYLSHCVQFLCVLVLTSMYYSQQENPFVIEDPRFLHGTLHKGIYTGLVIELMEQIAKRLDFDYTLSLAADGKYGIIDEETGTATGMVGELLRCVCIVL